MIDERTLVEIADNLARFRNFAWKPASEDRYFQEQVLTALEALLRAQGTSASGQDPQGLEAKPAGPVRKDAPHPNQDTPHE